MPGFRPLLRGRTLLIFGVLPALYLAACGRPAGDAPSNAVTSLYALVETIDGTYFYPPLGPEPAPAGAFDATLLARLQVVLEAEDGAGHTSTLGTFSASTQPGLALLGAHELYWMNVPAAAYVTDPSRSYRFRALLDGREIGRSDLDTGKVFDVMRYVPSLPIGVKLRIERRDAPVISALEPAHVLSGSGALRLTVRGSAFASDSVVSFAGRAVTTTKVSPAELVANVPDTFVAAPGSFDVTVATPSPGGGTSAARTLFVDNSVPTLTAISPASAVAGAPDLALTLDGADFRAGATASMNGAALPTIFVSASRLVATLPAARMTSGGHADITVTNPAPTAGSSAALTFTVNNRTPVLATLTPARMYAGSPTFTVTIDGWDFLSGAAARFNGAAVATTFVSTTRLRIVVPASAVLATGTFGVDVTNPSPTLGASGLAAFTVTETCATGDGFCPSGCNANTDHDCAPVCGNGVLEPGESCEGNCPTSCNDGLACTADTLVGSPATCNSTCAHQPITACVSGDGCCPAGCNANNDHDCPAVCGNGVVEPGETCDGSCPTSCSDGLACTSDALTGSPATCNAACVFTSIASCASGDGCCPAGCVNATDADCHDPVQFAFVDVWYATPGNAYSGSVTVSGLGAGGVAWATLTYGALQKNGASVVAPVQVTDGDVLTVSITASSVSGETRSGRLAVGSLSDAFDVRTMPFAPDYVVSASRGSDTNNGSAAAPFRTIGRAMALGAAVANKLVFVESGAYVENVTISQAGTVLYGEDPATTSILNTGGNHTVVLNGNDSKIQNFTVANAYSSTYYAILLNGIGNKVYNNVVFGGYMGIGSNATAARHEAVHNTVIGGQYGIYANYDQGFSRLVNNVVTACSYGIGIATANQPPTRGGNVTFANGSWNWSTYSTVSSDRSGDVAISILAPGRLEATGGAATDIGVGALADYGISAAASVLSSGAPDTGAPDAGAHLLYPPRSLYVAKTGADASSGLSASSPKLTIGAALAAAWPGAVVRVGAGVYAEALTMNTPGVTLLGNDPGDTILQNSGGNHVAVLNGSGTAIRNFTVGSVYSGTYYAILLSGYGNKAYNNVIYGGYMGIGSNATNGGHEAVHNTVIGGQYGIYANYDRGFARIRNNVVQGCVYGVGLATLNQPYDRGGNVVWANGVWNWSSYTTVASDRAADVPVSILAPGRFEGSGGAAVNAGIGALSDFAISSATSVLTSGAPDSGAPDSGAHLASGPLALYVAKSGRDTSSGLSASSPKLTIGAALAASWPGAVVHVGPGVYVEALTVNQPAVTLLGNDPGDTILQNLGGNHVVVLNGPGASLKNFTVGSVYSGTYYSVLLNGYANKVHNNVVFGGYMGIGSNAANGSHEAAYNTVIGGQYGIYANYDRGFARLRNNVVRGCAYGIGLANGNQPYDRGGNVAWGNGAWSWSNYTTVSSDRSSDVPVSTLAPGRFESTGGAARDVGIGTLADFAIPATSSVLTSGAADTGAPDAGAHLLGGPLALYVSKSGSDANNGLTPLTPKLTIGSALAASWPGAVINVGAGVYAEAPTVNQPGVTLNGDDPGSTILAGSASNHTVVLNGGGAAIRNFTIGNVYSGTYYTVLLNGYGNKVQNDAIFGGYMGIASNATNGAHEAAHDTVVGALYGIFANYDQGFARLRNNVVTNCAYGIGLANGNQPAERGGNVSHDNGAWNWSSYSPTTTDSSGDLAPSIVAPGRLESAGVAADLGVGTLADTAISATSSVLTSGAADSGNPDSGAHFGATSPALYVAKNGSDSNNGLVATSPKLTIGSAVAAAWPGAVIHVAPGVYFEAVTVNQAGVTLLGDDPGDTVLGNAGANHTVVLNGGGASIKNFTLGNAYSGGYYTVLLNGYGNRVYNNAIFGGYMGIGSNVTNGAQEAVYNTVVGGQYGIFANYDRGLTRVRNNVVTGNRFGLGLANGNQPQDRGGNVVWGNGDWNFSSYITTTSDYSADVSVSLLAPGRLEAAGGVALNAGVGALSDYAIPATSSVLRSGAVDTGVPDAGAHFLTGPLSLYVAKNGSDSNSGLVTTSPKLTVASALAASWPGAVIRISAGTYTETLTVNQPGVTLLGDDPGTVAIGSSGANHTIVLNGGGASVRNLTVGNTGTSYYTLLLNGYGNKVHNDALFGGYMGIGSNATGGAHEAVFDTVVGGTYGIYANYDHGFTRVRNNVITGCTYGLGIATTNQPPDRGGNVAGSNTSWNWSTYSTVASDRTADPALYGAPAPYLYMVPSEVKLTAGSPAINAGIGTLDLFAIPTASYTTVAGASSPDGAAVDSGVHFLQ